MITLNEVILGVLGLVAGSLIAAHIAFWRGRHTPFRFGELPIGTYTTSGRASRYQVGTRDRYAICVQDIHGQRYICQHTDSFEGTIQVRWTWCGQKRTDLIACPTPHLIVH